MVRVRPVLVAVALAALAVAASDGVAAPHGLPAGCHWSVPAPRRVMRVGYDRVVGRVTWKCRRDPNGFTATVEIDWQPPGQTWIPLGGSSTGNPGTKGRPNQLSIPATDRPGNYRAKGTIRVNSQRRSRTSAIVTLT